MMHDAIAKGRGTNQAQFTLADIEVAIRARLILTITQFLLELKEIRFQVIFKRRHSGAVAFAFARFTKSSIKIAKIGNLWVEMTIGLHKAIPRE